MAEMWDIQMTTLKN